MFFCINRKENTSMNEDEFIELYESLNQKEKTLVISRFSALQESEHNQTLAFVSQEEVF